MRKPITARIRKPITARDPILREAFAEADKIGITMAALAKAAGLDLVKAKAMPSAGINAMMKSDLEDANTLGVKGTPSFFVNGKPLAELGPEPLYAQVRAEVEAQQNPNQE